MSGGKTPLNINCKGRLIDLSQPKIMGIINATPDSFYDGGTNLSVDNALNSAAQMLAEGADFLDLGGYSSRPGASDVSPSEEADRVLPVIEAIAKEFPMSLISIDSFRSDVARQAVAVGACIINDISAGHLDAEMLPLVARLQVPYIMMHMRGNPQNMKTKTDYNKLLVDLRDYFARQLHSARALGINDLIIDPGFGFSKTAEQNFELLAQLEELKVLGLPVLVGVSRKSMIYKTLDTDAAQALNGTTVAHAMALERGANILRVHDVKAAAQCIALYTKLWTQTHP